MSCGHRGHHDRGDVLWGLREVAGPLLSLKSCQGEDKGFEHLRIL